MDIELPSLTVTSNSKRVVMSFVDMVLILPVTTIPMDMNIEFPYTWEALRRIGGLATLGFRQKFSKTVILMRVGARYHDVVHHQVDLSSSSFSYYYNTPYILCADFVVFVLGHLLFVA